jgi:hypothetical protein
MADKLGTPGFQAEGNILMTIGQRAVTFQRAQDEKNAIKRGRWACLRKWISETGEPFTEGEHEEDDELAFAIIDLTEKLKAAQSEATRTRSSMKRAIKLYHKCMDAERTTKPEQADTGEKR